MTTYFLATTCVLATTAFVAITGAVTAFAATIGAAVPAGISTEAGLILVSQKPSLFGDRGEVSVVLHDNATRKHVRKTGVHAGPKTPVSYGGSPVRVNRCGHTHHAQQDVLGARANLVEYSRDQRRRSGATFSGNFMWIPTRVPAFTTTSTSTTSPNLTTAGITDTCPNPNITRHHPPGGRLGVKHYLPHRSALAAQVSHSRAHAVLAGIKAHQQPRATGHPVELGWPSTPHRGNGPHLGQLLQPALLNQIREDSEHCRACQTGDLHDVAGRNLVSI